VNLNETGDHSLDVIDAQYPVFVLGGWIMDLRYHDGVATPRLEVYKRRLFGRSDFIIHTPDIVRRRGPFQKLTDKAFHQSGLLEARA
jgi:hypothetical protein